MNWKIWKSKPKQNVEKESALHNVHHPDFIGLTEPAFKVGDVQYYRFAKDTAMPWGRYMFMQTFLYEQDLRMDSELLNGYCEMMKKAINGDGKPGQINLVKLVNCVTNIQARVNLGFEVDTTYRLASCIYFDDTEDLYTYDKGYNDTVKLPAWKEARSVDFFYTRPMSELLGLNGMSPADLQTFIQRQTELLKDLVLDETSET